MYKCIHPYLLKVGKMESWKLIPCGKCMSCRKNYKTEWYVRLCCELTTMKYAKFITLTYDDDNLPKNGSLDKNDTTKFFKRLRKNNPDVKFRYYYCGEYGTLNARPHYHVILYYNKSIDDVKKVIDDSWCLGRVDVGIVEQASIMYCLNYVKKQIDLENNFEIKPFQCMSKNIGKEFAEKYKEDILKRGYIFIKGKKYSFPRYFKKISEEYDSVDKENKLNYRVKQGIKSGLKRRLELIELSDHENVQRKKNMEMQEKIKKQRSL